MLRNTPDTYGLVAIVLHWLTAFAVIGLFAMGLWMTGLDYYHPWYHRGPEVHKAVGILLAALLVLRLLWRLGNPHPVPESTHSAFERHAARVAHALLYALPFAVIAAGYLISTADGHPIDVFEVFFVPATLTGLPRQADRAGDVHLALAIALLTLVGIHALAALKHHFVDHDRTLSRMLSWRTPRNAKNPPTHP
jgi:cytochrome b561